MCRPADCPEVNGADGRAVCGPRFAAILDERSSRFGRGLEDGNAGEPGSFLTLMMGGTPLRSLCGISCWWIADVVAQAIIVDEVTHPFGELLPASTLDALSGEPPLLRARFAAGSVAAAAEV